ncbi:peptidase C45 acyl-coenzyme A:6-aminopenicillanic acid acyl-transferase [Maridesulfovibrio salexigens DSM 2638]|uniref:Peptidase C45 acyl-coenzyme A:6-aminopenicillanic acid acyl-transferase n=2 Tax=Maridesulfovibrio salexigens TaxID=880 RepID=C6BZM7_MARSD|nr:peptidase C45 acyl-coenzyme A:6-aminopenicillanic acid acyl-transferase [Maridesulfovibrio salexigens DSM 2638]
MLKIVELQGSYYEIGKGWGEVFRQEMDRIITSELGVIATYYGIDTETVIELGKKYLPAAQKYDPEFIEVLHGFAEGAGVSFDTIFAIRSVFDILCSGPPRQGMCTSLAVGGSASQNGQVIIGQNIDWHPGLPIALLKISWPNGVKQLALSMSGVWEYTLSAYDKASPFAIMSTLTVTPDTNPDISVPISFIMNKASRQKQLENALEVFTNATSTMPSYLLANGAGKMIGIELGLHSHELLYPESDVLIHANHNISERFAARDAFIQFVPDSPFRYDRMKKLAAQNHGKITPKRIMAFLADHENYPKGICSHVDPESQLPPSATVASVVIIPEEAAMYIAVGNPCENEYERYHLQTD